MTTVMLGGGLAERGGGEGGKSLRSAVSSSCVWGLGFGCLEFRV